MLESVIGTLLRPGRTSATWWALVHLCVGIVLGPVSFAVIIALGATTLGLLAVFPLAMVSSWLLFLATHGLANVERSRFRAFTDEHLPTPAPLSGATRWKRYLERLKSKARWKELAYLAVRYPISAITGGIALGFWCGGVGLLSMPLWIGAGTRQVADFGVFEITQGWGSVASVGFGAVLVLLVAPWVTLGMIRLELMVARGLLGRTDRVVFEERVVSLQSSRMAAVDAAENERRRVERDLHDGAQQRLIAVAMNLGMARQRLAVDPEAGQALVADAHEEVKAALKELRDLVRGIHPVILEDRGIDPALSAIVARSPIPIELSVHVTPRPDPSVESAAYFIVSEALANVARHSRARHASVDIVRRADRLTIIVTDDGIGGADASLGTGIAGLGERVSALDGWMQLISPVGGPTTLLVEVPCGS